MLNNCSSCSAVHDLAFRVSCVWVHQKCRTRNCRLNAEEDEQRMSNENEPE